MLSQKTARSASHRREFNTKIFVILHFGVPADVITIVIF
jgi:hypothetical protein